MSDVDYAEDREEEETVAPKKGGYDARVEQWLHEHPDQVILITNAGKEGVNYIQYTISCGVCIAKIRAVACTDTLIGPRSKAQILRVCLVARNTRQLTPHADSTAHTREAYNGRLRGQTNQSKRGCRHNRTEEAHVGCVPQSLSQNEGCSGRWRLLEVS
jgi:hypothetical protein